MPVSLGRPLTGNRYRTTLHKQRSLNDFELLRTAEQYALRFYLSGGQECPISQLDGSGTEQTAVLPSSALLMRLSQLLKEVANSDDTTLENSSLELLENPVSIIEFRRIDRSYKSLFLPFQKEERGTQTPKIEQKEIVKALIREFQISESDPVSDTDLETNFENLSTIDLNKIAKSSLNGNSGQETECHEFNELMRPLTEHLFRTFDPDFAQATEGVEVNRFFRAALENWKNGIEMAAVDSGLSEENRDSLNVYPYVAIRRLQTLENAIAIVCVTQIDRLFQDKQIDRDHRLPGISIAVCMENQFSQATDDDLLALQEAFQARLSSLTAKRMAYLRGIAIDSSGGEAAMIGRFWFGNGVTNLLKTKEDAGDWKQRMVLSSGLDLLKNCYAPKLTAFLPSKFFHLIERLF